MRSRLSVRRLSHDMSAYVCGLDVHKESTYATVLGLDGKTVAQGRMRNESKATATDKDGNRIPLEGFKAESGRVTGGCTFKIPEEYARWGTIDELQVTFVLAAVDGKLKGLIETPVAKLPLTLEKV